MLSFRKVGTNKNKKERMGCCCSSVERSEHRFYAAVYLISLVTQTSGDIGPVGEWYFKTGEVSNWTYKTRFPTTGFIRMSVNESFEAEPTQVGWGYPLLYSAMLDDRQTPNLEFVMRLWESDAIKDDCMLDCKIRVPIHEAVTKDGVKQHHDDRKEEQKAAELHSKIVDGFHVYPANKNIIVQTKTGEVKCTLLVHLSQRPEW